MRLLTEVADGKMPFLAAAARKRAAAAVARGGLHPGGAGDGRRRTHHLEGRPPDPLTLAPVPARRLHELVGLAGRESARITSYLIDVPIPSARVGVAAVDGAVAWFRAHRIRGYGVRQERAAEAERAARRIRRRPCGPA